MSFGSAMNSLNLKRTVNCKSVYSFTVMSLFSLILSGCGGGGDSASAGGGSDGSGNQTMTPAEPVEITRSSDLTIQEESSAVSPVEGQIQSIRKIRGDDTIDATPGESAVSFSVDELLNEAEARFEVITENGNEIITYFFSVVGQNTSAVPLVQQGVNLSGLPVTTTALQDDQRLTEIVLEVQYLANELSSTDRDRIIEEIDTAFQEIGAIAQEDIDALNRTLRNYETGSADENELNQAILSINATIRALGAVGESTLESYAEVLNDLGARLPENLSSELPLVFDERINRYSRFTNSRLGSYSEDGRWQFGADFDFLNSALIITP